MHDVFLIDKVDDIVHDENNVLHILEYMVDDMLHGDI